MSEFEDEITRGWLEETPSLNSRDMYSSAHRRKVYIGFFKRNITEGQLRDYFGRYGNIDKLHMMRDGFGATRGFSFIVFVEEASVDALLADKPHVLLGVQLVARRAFPRDCPRTQTRNNHFKDKIFIGGLPKKVKKHELHRFFESSYSKSPLFVVEDISIPSDSLGLSKGFAFIKFSNEDIVDKIIYDFPRAEIAGRLCEIKRAEIREDDTVRCESPVTPTRSSLPENVGTTRPSYSESPKVPFSDPATSSLRLVSSGVEKMRRLGVVPPMAPLSNVTNTDLPVVDKKWPLSPKSLKRSFNQRLVQPEAPVSDSLDQQTLARIGKMFIDLVSHSIESDSSLKSDTSMSSLLISTLHQIILNVKNSQ